jgi:threonine dehydratase
MTTSEEFRGGLDAVLAAYERIRNVVHRTPVFTCRAINEQCSATVFFKCENFQRVGAFKFRGASYAVLSLADEEAVRGVVTHSSGNHAAALALAARIRSIPAYIVMPRNAPAIKRQAVENYGGQITECEPTQEAREIACRELMHRTGATLIHPYDDPRVIAGQGTAALEFLQDVPDLDVLIAPVGGGGLLSGTALAGHGLKPGIRIIGAEPRLADDAAESLRRGQIVPARPPVTIADGLRTSLGKLTFAILRQHVEAIALADEEEIVAAQRLIMERMKIVVEPSAAVPLAALLFRPLGLQGLRVGIILSGGNVDLSPLFARGDAQS